MMQARLLWIGIAGLLVAGACGGKGEDSEEPTKLNENAAGETPNTDNAGVSAAELRVVLGDCVAGDVAFESGPRPLPFDAQALLDPGRAAEEDFETGGTGTAEAFDEGKMGKRDSTRVTGQYAMKPSVAPKVSPAAESRGGPWPEALTTGDLSGSVSDRKVYGGALGDDRSGKGGGMTGRPAARRGRPPAQSSVRMVNASFNGDLDANIIRRYIQRQYARVKHCYERELLTKPTLKGEVVVSFAILGSGSVMAPKASGVDDAVSACVAQTLGGIQFPKPMGGGKVTVSFSLEFSKTTAGAATPKTRYPKPPPRQVYVPGKKNLLQGNDRAVATCFAAQSKQQDAVLVVDVDTTPSGKPTRVYGISDSAAASCIGAIASRVALAKSSGRLRCSLALGVRPAGSARGVDIDAGEVRYAGDKVAAVRELNAAAPEQWKVVELYERTRAERQSRMMAARSRPAVVAETVGLVLVRPVDSTPMKVVIRVSKTLAAAGYDPVLAAQNGDSWRALRELVLPVVPVPATTGAPWSGAHGGAGSGSFGTGIPSSPVVISVLVTATEIWAGDTTGAQQQIAHVGGLPDLGALAKVLRTLGTARPVTMPGHVELGAEAAVSYRSMVSVIEAVATGGYPEWQLLDPPSLAVRFKR